MASKNPNRDILRDKNHPQMEWKCDGCGDWFPFHSKMLCKGEFQPPPVCRQCGKVCDKVAGAGYCSIDCVIASNKKGK